jgi:hypothetical protein
MQAVTARGDVAHLPSELIANPGRYDGKHVTLRGYVVIGAESRNIFDSEAGYNDAHGACLGLDGPKAAFRIFHRGYSKKISGTFEENCAEKTTSAFFGAVRPASSWTREAIPRCMVVQVRDDRTSN